MSDMRLSCRYAANTSYGNGKALRVTSRQAKAYRTFDCGILPLMESSLNTSNRTHLDLGKIGELFAAAHLEQNGYRLVAANFTLPVGRNRRDAVITAELDLIAYDGRVLCFVEVKTRKSDWFASPEANVDRHKRRQIARAAREYRQMFGIEDEPYRYDVVTVVLGEDRTSPRIDLFKNYWREDKLKKPRFERFYD